MFFAGRLSEFMNRGRSSSLRAREPYVLCNLCAETKEMWKKSGAWFFKSLPKYILPDKRPTTKYNEELARSLQVKKLRTVFFFFI